MTSLQLNKKINLMRIKGGEKTEQRHFDLVVKIAKEFGVKNLKWSKYRDEKGEIRPLVVLTKEQSTQILMSEGRIGRKYVVKEVLKGGKEKDN